jgi:hypothetical protein
VCIQKPVNWVAIKAHEKFYRRHMADIPGVQFFVQRRYRANWAFMVVNYLSGHARLVNVAGRSIVPHVERLIAAVTMAVASSRNR